MFTLYIIMLLFFLLFIAFKAIFTIYIFSISYSSYPVKLQIKFNIINNLNIKLLGFFSKFRQDKHFRVFIYFIISFFFVTKLISVFIKSFNCLLLSCIFIILCIVCITLFKSAYEFKPKGIGLKKILLKISLVILIYLVFSIAFPLKDLLTGLFELLTIFSAICINLEDLTLNMDSGLNNTGNSGSNNGGGSGNSNYNNGAGGGPNRPNSPNFANNSRFGHQFNYNRNENVYQEPTAYYATPLEKELSEMRQTVTDLNIDAERRIADLNGADHMARRGCYVTAQRRFRSATEFFKNDTITTYNKIVDLNDLATTETERSIASDCFDLNHDLTRKINYYLSRVDDVEDKVRIYSKKGY